MNLGEFMYALAHDLNMDIIYCIISCDDEFKKIGTNNCHGSNLQLTIDFLALHIYSIIEC